MGDGARGGVVTPAGPPRPQGEVVIHQARHGAWIVEVHYRGSAIRDVVGMRQHQGEALALAEFTRVWRADDQLAVLDREGDRIAAEDAWERRWQDAGEEQ
jgi:hypothetical protein